MFLPRSLLSACAALALLGTAPGQNVTAYHNASNAGHQAQFTALANNGYRMLSLAIYGTTNDPRYAAVWVQRAGPNFIGFHDKTSAEYQALVVANCGTYAPTIVTARGSGNNARFAGVLEQVGYACYAKHDLGEQAFIDEVGLARDQGWRIATADVYGSGNDPRYIVTFKPNPDSVGWGYTLASSVSQHQELFMGMNPAYARPVATTFNDTHSRFIGTWEDTVVGTSYAHHDMTASEYQQFADQYANQGYYAISVGASDSGNGVRHTAVWAPTDVPKPRQWSVAGPAVPDLGAFDSWMETWMKSGAVRGASLAVAKNGKLVLARGYTWAESGYPQVQPTSLFRIASCSKPLTSIAIHRAIQKSPGSFNYGTLMSDLFGNPVMADPRAGQITLEHLLTHQGGWDRNDTGSNYDPMFYDSTIAAALNVPLPITLTEVRFFMQGQALDFTPGNPSVYSNYGYSLLGQILDRRYPGKTYPEVIQDTIFAPLGVTRARIGGSHLDQRLAGEVLYHPRRLSVSQSVNDPARPRVPNHYGGWNQPNMDAHGAWVMAAPDFAKVLAAFDLGVQNPLLGLDQTNAMWSLAPGMNTWLHGWFRNSVPDGVGGNLDIREHNGVLPGTRAYVGRRKDGLSFVVFTNGEQPLGGNQGRALSEIANGISIWPTHDLFGAMGIMPFTHIDDIMSPFGSPCPGSAGTPVLLGSGSAQIGAQVGLDLMAAKPNSPAFLMIGGVPAAVDLSPIGAPGCVLSTDPVLTLGLLTDRSGAASVPLPVPVEHRLVRSRLFAQYAIVDAGANVLGLHTTNGLDIQIGGWLGN